MAKELTGNERIYCEKFVELGVKKKAYEFAYSSKNMKSTTISSEACKLHKRVKIQAEISRIQKELQDRSGETLKSLTDELNEVRERAFAGGNLAVAVSTIVAKAKMHGFYDKDVDGGGGSSFSINISSDVKKKGVDSS